MAGDSGNRCRPGPMEAGPAVYLYSIAKAVVTKPPMTGRNEVLLPLPVNKIEKVATMSKLITSKQAAKYLCISERKLWELKKTQRIPVVRIDRSVRFDRDDLDAFIAQMKKK